MSNQLWKKVTDLTVTRYLRRAAQERIIPVGTGQSKVGGTSGWVIGAADNVALATCPASQTGSKLIIPVPSLRVGDVIRGFWLIGQIESAGNTVTLDADLRSQLAAAADFTDASVAAMTQISVTADTKVDNTNSRKNVTAPGETVQQDKSYYIVVTATTGASTDIGIAAVGLIVDQN